MKQVIKVRLIAKDAVSHIIEIKEGSTVNRQVADAAVLLCTDAVKYTKLPNVEITCGTAKPVIFSMIKDAAKLSFTLLIKLADVIFSDVTDVNDGLSNRTAKVANEIALQVLQPFKFKDKVVSYTTYTTIIKDKFSGIKTVIKADENAARLLTDKKFASIVATARLYNSEAAKVFKAIADTAKSSYAKNAPLMLA